jgi:hypothetical protein
LARQNTPGSPFLHDITTNDIIGIKDADGGEKRFVYTDDLGVFFSGQIDITDTTASTDPTTGALTVAGGTGIAGALNVGGAASVVGVATISNTTDSTTKDNGALVVEGGVGVEKALTVGGQLRAAATTASTSATTGAAVVSGGAGIAGALNVSGGMTVTPNSGAPTSNVTIGPSAGAAISGATNNVLIGQGAGDTITGSNGSVAIGLNALGAQVDGATLISNTVAGTLSTVGSITGVQLVKDSGVGVMAVYPIVTLTVAAGGDVTEVVVTTPGSGATVPNGIVFSTSDARIDPAWRGTLAGVPLNSAVGRDALQSNTTGTNNSAMGLTALQDNTTGGSNSALGVYALYSNTTGSNNSAVGLSALFSNTTGNFNSALGTTALGSNTTGTNNSAMGVNAGRFRGASPSTDEVTVATSSVFIGFQSRAAGDSQTNQIVIGANAVGNGSNTTTIGNSSTTGTFIAGTATSLFAIAGDTMRIVGTRNPASNAAGTAGDFAFGSTGGSTYLYYCIASGNWGRVALTTGY